MLRKLKQSKNRGFTIIEVMIVLAIAALIMLIVFLAVPALQRSSHNTSRKEDVGRIGAAVNDFISNNNGNMPTSLDQATIQTGAGTLGQYSGNYLTIDTKVDGDTTTSLKKIIVDTGAQCNGTSASTGGTATDRSIAILYAVETGGGSGSAVCLNG